MAMSQCAACGRTFTSLTAFDQHQDVDYKRRPAVICRDPAAAGLVQGNDGRWRLPLSASGRARVEKISAERAAGGI